MSDPDQPRKSLSEAEARRKQAEIASVATAPPSRLAATRPLPGSLPLDETTGSPSILFAPPHLRPAPDLRFLPRSQAPEAARQLNGEYATTTSGLETTGDGAGLDGVQPATSSTVSADITEHARTQMLGDPAPPGAAIGAAGRRADATYDFSEYVLLRNADDPVAKGLSVGSGAGLLPMPSDPRFSRYLTASYRGIASWTETVLGIYFMGGTPAQDIMERHWPTSWPSGGTTSARCGPSTS